MPPLSLLAKRVAAVIVANRLNFDIDDVRKLDSEWDGDGFVRITIVATGQKTLWLPVDDATRVQALQAAQIAAYEALPPTNAVN